MSRPRDDVALSSRLDVMAQDCARLPGVVGSEAFDDFVDELRRISEPVAAAFVRRVYDLLTEGEAS